MNIEPHETAIRTADGWQIFDSWNAKTPIAFVADSVESVRRQNLLLNSFIENPTNRKMRLQREMMDGK